MKRQRLIILLLILLISSSVYAQNQNFNLEKITNEYIQSKSRWKKKARRKFFKRVDKDILRLVCGNSFKKVKNCELIFVPILSAHIKRIDTVSIHSVLENIVIDRTATPMSIVVNGKNEVIGECFLNYNPKWRARLFRKTNNFNEYKQLQEMIDFAPDLLLTIENTSFQGLLIKDGEAYVLNDQGYQINPTYLGGSDMYIRFEEFYTNNSVRWIERIWKQKP